MRNFLLVLMLFLLAPLSETHAQDQLSPAYSSFGWQSRYDRLIKEILFKDGNSPIATFMIAGVSVLALDWETNKDNTTKYLLTHRKTTGTSIWSAYKEEISSSDAWKKLDHSELKVTVEAFNASISDSLAMAIRSLFQTALSQTRLPHRQGFDGVIYTFTSVLDIGSVWSPTKGSKMYQLTEIGKALIEYTKSFPIPDSIAEQTLITQMDELRKELELIVLNK